MPDSQLEPKSTLPHIQGYEVVRKLSEGASASVYLATDLTLHRQVAIKILVFSENDPGYHQALLEARAMAQFSHPNITTIYDVVAQPDRVLLVMAFSQGQTLRQCMRTSQPTLAASLGYLVSISKGLAAVHRESLIHGDLKPENIWIPDSGEATLLDFGIAQRVRQQGILKKQPLSSHVHSGTPQYSAPEKLDNLPLKTSSDIFSLGVVAYELLAGFLPFGDGDDPQTRQRIRKGEHIDPAEIVPALPATLADLLRQLIDVEPIRRPANAEWVSGRFQEASKRLEHQQQADLQTVELNPPDAARMQGSKRGLAAVLSVCLFCALGGGWLALSPNSETGQSVMIVSPLDKTPSHQQASTHWIKMGLEDRLRFEVANRRSVKLVDEPYASADEQMLGDLMKRSGASDALLPSIRCSATLCDIEIAHYRAEEGP